MWPALCGRYCPQFDALFEKLTVREHLQLYSRIKGLSEQQVCGLSPWVRNNLKPRGGYALHVRDSSSLLLALTRVLSAAVSLSCVAIQVARVVAESIQNLGLTKFEHKMAGTLSGGNKRKLSVAIALIAEPPIIFLGECCAALCW